MPQISSQPMETNSNIVLPEETNLTIKSSFETEESGKIFIFLMSSKTLKLVLKLKIYIYI